MEGRGSASPTKAIPMSVRVTPPNDVSHPSFLHRVPVKAEPLGYGRASGPDPASRRRVASSFPREKSCLEAPDPYGLGVIGFLLIRGSLDGDVCASGFFDYVFSGGVIVSLFLGKGPSHGKSGGRSPWVFQRQKVHCIF